MALVNYKTTNNAETTLLGDISASATSIIVNTGEGDLFPSTFPFLLTLEQYNASGLVIKREIVKATARVDDTITITRAQENCVQNDTANPKTLTNNALSFASGDKVSIYNTAGNDKDLKDELVRLETDKANDSEVIHNTGDETGIAGNKTFTGNITANAFIGDGSGLTGLPTPTTNINGLTEKTTPVDADEFIIYDTAGATNKKVGLDNLKNSVAEWEYLGSLSNLAGNTWNTLAVSSGNYLYKIEYVFEGRGTLQLRINGGTNYNRVDTAGTTHNNTAQIDVSAPNSTYGGIITIGSRSGYKATFGHSGGDWNYVLNNGFSNVAGQVSSIALNNSGTSSTALGTAKIYRKAM